MTLSQAAVGEEALIKKIGGQEEQRLFLENLGFVPGSRVRVVNKNGGNIIVNVRESRVALGSEMAVRIVV
jgi:ferrous iron transport protein A